MRADVQSLSERKTILEQELNAITAGREAMKRLGARLATRRSASSRSTMNCAPPSARMACPR